MAYITEKGSQVRIMNESKKRLFEFKTQLRPCLQCSK